MRQFYARVRAFRERAGLQPEEVAVSLGIRVDTYQRYEKRRAMPHDLIPKFLILTGGDANELFGLKKKTPANRAQSPHRAIK